MREAASYGRASEIGRLPHSLLATGSTLVSGTGKYCSFAALVVISQSQKAAGKKLGRIGKEMKGFGIALALILAAYLADANFSNGKYADAATRMAVQMRHSFGI